MAIHYYCRHCMESVGLIESAVKESRLGLDKLTEEDRQELLTYDSDGNLHIGTICEKCEQEAGQPGMSGKPDTLFH